MEEYGLVEKLERLHEIHEYIETNIDEFSSMRRNFEKRLADGTWPKSGQRVYMPDALQNERYWNWAESVYYFWLRRDIDGTRPQFYRMVNRGLGALAGTGVTRYASEETAPAIDKLDTLESGISLSNIVSISDHQSLSGETFEVDSSLTGREFGQEALSAGTYRVFFTSDGDDHKLHFEALIAPDAASPALDFERFRKSRLANYVGEELSEVPQLRSLGAQSFAFRIEDEDYDGAFGLIVKSRNVLLAVDAFPPITDFEKARQRVLIVLDRLSRIDYRPDSGLLRDVQAANVSMQNVRRFPDFAADYGLLYDPAHLEEKVSDKYEPGMSSLTYDAKTANGLEFGWVLFVLGEGSGLDATALVREFSEDMQAGEQMQAFENSAFESWNDETRVLRAFDQ